MVVPYAWPVSIGAAYIKTRVFNTTQAVLSTQCLCGAPTLTNSFITVPFILSQVLFSFLPRLLFVCRLHQVKCGVVAVSILTHLASPPFTLLDPSVFPSLVSLLTRCLLAATSAACTTATLNKDWKPSTMQGAAPAISGAVGEEREGEETEEGQRSISIPELLGLISYCRVPSGVSSVTTRTLAHDIAVLTVSYSSSLYSVMNPLLGC